MHAAESAPFVNNRNNVYIPVPLCCGVTVNVRLGLFLKPYLLPAVLSTLNEDCTICLTLLPHSVHPLIRRTKIWVNGGDYRIGEQRNPQILHHMTTHHYEGWLDWARDRRDKALGIEIYNATQYLQMRCHWNGAGGLLLHEFCHLIHQHVFGLDCLRIQRLYGVAVSSHRYDCVPRRDWAGAKQTTDMAYCMVDHKEFFAELSVTYWSRGYTELDTACRDDVMACSPPLVDKDVLERVARLRWDTDSPCQYPVQTISTHCNKFYPFTSGQFRHCDPEMYNEFEALWGMIEDWIDPTMEHELHRCFPCTPRNKICFPKPLSENPARLFKVSDAFTPLHSTPYRILDTVDM